MLANKVNYVKHLAKLYVWPMDYEIVWMSQYIIDLNH